MGKCLFRSEINRYNYHLGYNQVLAILCSNEKCPRYGVTIFKPLIKEPTKPKELVYLKKRKTYCAECHYYRPLQEELDAYQKRLENWT